MGFQRSKRRAQKSKRPTKKIKEALAFSKTELAQKPRPIFFSRFVRTCHMLLDGISEIEEAIPDIGEASAFADVSTSVTCRVSFAKITGSLSKRRFQPSAFADMSTSITCRSQLYGNYRQSVEDLLTRRKRAISQHLVSIFRSETDCLEPLPDCLPSLALEYSSSSSYASSSSTTSAWGTDKGSENDTSKHVETIYQFILS
ncbi:hypothetical protein ACFXTH_032772 [Malus domestica]